MSRITPDMTVLDVVSRYKGAEAVFRRHDAQAGCRILCEALFEPLSGLAERFGLDLSGLLAQLEAETEET